MTASLVQASPPQAVDAPSVAGSAGMTLFALVFVVGLILLLGKLAKKMSGMGAFGNRDDFRVVASLPLGAKDRVVVLQVGQNQVLVGVGADGPRLITQLDAPLSVSAPRQAATTDGEPQPSFSDALRKASGLNFQYVDRISRRIARMKSNAP